jgi:hypothetical protein
MQIAQLPHIDEHAIDIAVSVDEAWPVLLDTVDRGFARFGASGYARVVGCTDIKATGPRPLAVGSTVPGFHVTAAIPGVELALEGRHRFSSYALIFRLERVGAARSRLVAETRATFPGLAGGVYRLLVIRTRGHVVAVRRILSTVKRRSESR